jgi:hypothetical protein
VGQKWTRKNKSYLARVIMEGEKYPSGEAKKRVNEFHLVFGGY